MKRFAKTKKKKQKKTKQKKKNSNSKNFVFWTLPDKFPQITKKKLRRFIFFIPFFLVSFVQNAFLELYCLCYLFESESELESCETYRLKLHTKAP